MRIHASSVQHMCQPGCDRAVVEPNSRGWFSLIEPLTTSVSVAPLLLLVFLCRPDPQDSAAVAAWLKALPDLKAAMSAYVDTVSSMTDSAIQDYQSRIAQLEQQRTNVHAQADAYLQTLLAQGQELLADMTAKQQTHKQQLQMPAVVQQEMLAIAVPQPQQYAQERQPDGQLQQWLEQQQQQQQDGAPAPSGDAVAMAANASGSSRPVSAADAGKPQQQLLGQHGLQPQQDQAPVAKAVAAAAAGKGSSSAGGAACAQQQQEQEEAAARDSHPHQHDQQQAAVLQQAAPLPQAPPQQAPITAEVDMTSPLPFPGGPLNKWLAPRLQVRVATYSCSSGAKLSPLTDLLMIMHAYLGTRMLSRWRAAVLCVGATWWQRAA